MLGRSGVSDVKEPSDLEIALEPYRGKAKQSLTDCSEFCDSPSVGLVSFGFGLEKSPLLEREC